MPRCLNVAEKPSVAREVSKILSNGNDRKRQGKSKYNPIHEFDCNVKLNGQSVNCSMVFTSVSGHLQSVDFGPEHSWSTNCDPLILLDPSTKVIKSISQSSTDIAATLKQESRSVDFLILWLDCDREGENIAFEVMHTCMQANPRIIPYRAHFSALIPADIHHAINNLVRPNKAWSDAVDARMEIDLRIGAAFTRFQSVSLRSRMPYLDGSKPISYGPCQFPTLGFVVDRFRERLAFITISFYNIMFDFSLNGETATFSFDRGRLFDHTTTAILLEMMSEVENAFIVSVIRSPRNRIRPLPLSTVEMQKRLATSARLSAHRTMEIAEKLYQRGIISYPRTETEIFKAGTDLQSLLQTIAGDQNGEYGNYARKLLNGAFVWPREGTKDDKAHPPIHPTKLELGLSGEEKTVYNFIVRHFLACCSEDAHGEATTVQAKLSFHTFTTKGLSIRARNYLDIYPFDRWTGTFIPQFQPGQSFQPIHLRAEDGRTQPPPLLNESALISAMDRNGIGTDATIAQHIKTVLDRGYAIVHSNVFVPTPLGLGLVEGYDALNLALSSPALRAHMERELKAVSDQQKSKNEVISSVLADMRATFLEVRQHRTEFLDGVEHAITLEPPLDRLHHHSMDNLNDEPDAPPAAPAAAPMNAVNHSAAMNRQPVQNQNQNHPPVNPNIPPPNPYLQPRQPPPQYQRPYSSLINDDDNEPAPTQSKRGRGGSKQGTKAKKSKRGAKTATTETESPVQHDRSAPSSDNCVHCNSSQHFSSNCPQRSQPASRGRGQGRGGAASGGTIPRDSVCFKCQQKGHWSNTCPNS